MKILEHGTYTKKEDSTEKFTCPECECVFKAKQSEYYVDHGTYGTTYNSVSLTYPVTFTDTYACSCPECHKMVTKTKKRESSVYTTLTSTNVLDTSLNSVTLNGTEITASEKKEG